MMALRPMFGPTPFHSPATPSCYYGGAVSARGNKEHTSAVAVRVPERRTHSGPMDHRDYHQAIGHNAALDAIMGAK